MSRRKILLERIQKGSATYAVYNVNEGNSKIDYISQNMINNNQEEGIGLAPVQVEMINGVIQSILFDITGRITLKEYISLRVSQNSFKRVLINLVDAMENFEEYLIDIHQILLDTDYVYVNQVDNSITFLCVVLQNYKQENDVFKFFKQIVENSHVETVLNVTEKDYFHIAWNITRNENGFSLRNLKAVLMNGSFEHSDVSQNAKVEQTPQKPNETEAPIKYNEPSLMTVTPVDIPKPEVMKSQPVITPKENVVPTQQPFVLGKHDDKKKGGILGRLFGSKGENDNNANNLSNKIQGGLSSVNRNVVGFANKNNSVSANNPAAAVNNSAIRSSGLSRLKMQAEQPQAAPVPDIEKAVPIQTTSQPINAAATIGDNSAGTTVLSSMTFQGGVTSSDPGTTVLGSSNIPNMGNTQMQNQIDLNKKPSLSQVVNAVDHSKSYPSQPSVPKPAAMGYNGVSDKNYSYSGNSGNVAVNDAVNYGETTVLDGGMSGETTVLNPSQLENKPSAYLVRLRYNERVPITGNVFRIGKERSSVNYFISDNTAISRNHASIVIKNYRYYIIDNNSTNHTFVNGQQIPSNYEVEIINNMKIRLANEDFEFHQ